MSEPTPPKHPLRQALVGTPGDQLEPLQWRTAVVTAVDKTSSPYRLTIRFADGTVVPGVTYLGWWDAEVNALVHVAKQGPALVVWGPNSPAKVTVVAPAAPPPPPAPPAPPPTIRTVAVTPTGMSSWDGRYDRWRTDGVFQGGGWSQRGFWYYGAAIAAAKGSGTILSGRIYIERQNTAHGVAGTQEANVRLGTHGYTGQPGTGGTAHGNVARVGGLARGKGKTLALTAAQVAALNGGAKGLGLEPGALGYTSADYLIATMGGASGQLSLTVQS